jgi:Tfp pilus assembly protein PilO
MKPKQFFYVVLGMIAVLALAGGGGYYLVWKQLQTQSATLATQLAEQKAVGDQIETLERLRRQYNRDIEPILPLMDAALPRDKKQTEILAQLQNIAQQVGLTIAAVSMPSPIGLPTSVSQTVKAGTVLALPINFQLAGSYTQLQDFTVKVENLNRFTNITILGISHPDKTRPIVYTISLNAYIKP